MEEGKGAGRRKKSKERRRKHQLKGTLADKLQRRVYSYIET